MKFTVQGPQYIKGKENYIFSLPKYVEIFNKTADYKTIIKDKELIEDIFQQLVNLEIIVDNAIKGRAGRCDKTIIQITYDCIFNHVWMLQAFITAKDYREGLIDENKKEIIRDEAKESYMIPILLDNAFELLRFYKGFEKDSAQLMSYGEMLAISAYSHYRLVLNKEKAIESLDIGVNEYNSFRCVDLKQKFLKYENN